MAFIQATALGEVGPVGQQTNAVGKSGVTQIEWCKQVVKHVSFSQQNLCRQPAIWVIEEKKRLKTIEGMGFCKNRVHAQIFDL